MTTLAHTGPIAAASTPKRGKRLTFVSVAALALFIGATSLVTIAVIIGVIFGFAFSQADGATTMLRSLLSDNRLSAADIELGILGVALALSIFGLLLIFFTLGLPDDSKQ